MNTNPFASYPIIKSHFDKVHLFSQKPSFPNNSLKTRHSCSNTSTKHFSISHNITVVHTYPHHSSTPVIFKNSLSSSHFSHFSKEINFKVRLIWNSYIPNIIIPNSLLQKTNHNSVILFEKKKFWNFLRSWPVSTKFHSNSSKPFYPIQLMF